jgi:hypothetical protein
MAQSSFIAVLTNAPALTNLGEKRFRIEMGVGV